ncbi:hypothetical protein [Candidatus Portiera aleyrodidarum]|uniref:hypothetical protein n=1 Tax=Candidatus Portiera aleyrodidarum TaxID=91844 RepID=UPI0015FFD6AC|nr:hypothetical protein [Candidatus Portiera aleyrodidarum]
MEIMEIPNEKALRNQRQSVFNNRVNAAAYRNYIQRERYWYFIVKEEPLVDKGFNGSEVELEAVAVAVFSFFTFNS